MDGDRTGLDWPRALGWRLDRQYLGAVPSGGVVETAARLCGVQAQVASCAELAVSVRTAGGAPADVRRALWTDRTLVKTWAMRGTLHLLPAAELPLWSAALRTRVRRMTPSRERYLGVDADDAEAVTEAVPDLLRGRCLTREELTAELAERVGPRVGAAVRSGWGALLKPSAWRGDLCFGPDRGRNVTFVSPRDWLPGPWRERDPEAAQAAVLRRFLDAYGPATRDDFARWWGVEPRWVRGVWDAADLVEVRLDGRPAYLTPEGAAAAAGAGPASGVRLLPGFDAYVLAPLSHRDHLVPAGLRDRVSRAAGWISAVLLVDGRIAGTWRHERTGTGYRLTVEPFAPLAAKVRRALRAEADRYADLLGAPVDL